MDDLELHSIQVGVHCCPDSDVWHIFVIEDGDMRWVDADYLSKDDAVIVAKFMVEAIRMKMDREGIPWRRTI